MRREHFPEIEDAELVVRALLGDLEAFDELVRRYRGAVTAVARQALDSEQAAEDVAQEALLLAFKALPQLEEPERFGPWLCAITRHRARRVATQEARSEPRLPTDLDELILESSRELTAHPHDDLLKAAERDQIHHALGRLPKDHRTVLWLYYFEDWPVARIGEFLSLPVTTVKWRLHQGRAEMRRRLGPGMERKHDERELLCPA
jgi:RNA polymerase sigma-70 factor (ECF subfamily)